MVDIPKYATTSPKVHGQKYGIPEGPEPYKKGKNNVGINLKS